jgi:hypothetical protein
VSIFGAERGNHLIKGCHEFLDNPVKAGGYRFSE